jgi:hypothetical protein
LGNFTPLLAAAATIALTGQQTWFSLSVNFNVFVAV